MRTKLIRPQVKILDAKKGLIETVVSDESVDRDGDIIRQDHWDLSNFEKHPVLLANHDYSSLESQIGEWTEMAVRDSKSAKSQSKALVGVAKYYIGQGNDQADWGFSLAERGKAAYSVGFIPDMDKAEELEGENVVRLQ